MIKDIFVLKKNSWHVRLMSYMWKLDTDDFTHMCPYFWLVVISIIIFIPYIIFRTFKSFILKTFVKVSSIQDEREKEWKLEYMNTLKRNPKERLWYFKNHRKSKKLNYFLDSIYYDDTELFEELRIGIQSYEKDVFKNKKIINKDKINNILKLFKPFAKGFLYTLAALTLIVVGFFCGMLLNYLFNVPFNNYLIILERVGIALFAIVIFIISLFCTYLLFSKVIKKLFIGFISLPIIEKGFNIIIRFFNAIGSFVSFLIQMLKDECPSIKWED